MVDLKKACFNKNSNLKCNISLRLYYFSNMMNSKMSKLMAAKMKKMEMKEVSSILVFNAFKNIENNVETDVEFIQKILEIAEHASVQKKELFAKRADLTEQEYDLIEGIGQIHYQSNIFNETSSKQISKVDENFKCPCGCKRAYGESLPYCINVEEQNFFGPGIILFFFYTKRMLLLLFLIAMVYGLFSLLTNVIDKNKDANCFQHPGAFGFMCDFKVQVSVEQKQTEMMIVQLVLGLIACIIWSISVRLIRGVGRKKEKKIDDLLDSSSDYCVFIQNLPAGQYSEINILRYLDDEWKSLKETELIPLKIKAVEIIYNMDEVREKIDFIHNEALKIVKNVKVKESKSKGKKYIIKDHYVQKYKEKKKNIFKVYDQLKEWRENFMQNSQFRSKRASECAIVEFQSSEQKTKFVEEFGVFRKTFVKELIKKIKSYCEDRELQFGKRIKIYRAPQPSDIFWKHCEKPISKFKIFLVWLINFFLISLSLGVLIGINELKRQHKLKWLSIIGIVTLNLFNRLIWNVLLNVIFIQENYTKTDNIISVMNKSYLTQAINLIVVPMVVHIGFNDHIDGADGLTGQIHDFQLTSVLFMTLFNLVNVPHRIVMFIQCIKCFRRMAIRYFCRIAGELDTMEEIKDAITFLYDPPVVPVAGFYVYITTIISQAAFYCHLSPIILFYLVGNIIFFHFINRHLVLRMSKIPDMIDFLVFETCVGYALNFPLLYGLGSIIFLNLRGDAPNFGYYVPSILCIIIWFISVQSPFGIHRKIVDCLINCLYGKEKEKKSEKFASQDHFVLDVLEENEKNMTTVEDEGISKRKENYYGANGTLEMFNFQRKLLEVIGPYHNKNKEFCQRFNLLGKNSASSLKKIVQVDFQ